MPNAIAGATVSGVFPWSVRPIRKGGHYRLPILGLNSCRLLAQPHPSDLAQQRLELATCRRVCARTQCPLSGTAATNPRARCMSGSNSGFGPSGCGIAAVPRLLRTQIGHFQTSRQLKIREKLDRCHPESCRFLACRKPERYNPLKSPT